MFSGPRPRRLHPFADLGPARVRRADRQQRPPAGRSDPVGHQDQSGPAHQGPRPGRRAPVDTHGRLPRAGHVARGAAEAAAGDRERPP
ncbi:hypothetical protein ACWDA8_46115 [Streptomyces sp. NPDC001130]